MEEQPRMSKLVKFYNWLEEVEGRTSIKSNPNLENWYYGRGSTSYVVYF